MKPPRLATWLLKTFGHLDTLEEVQGDLMELYAYWVETMGVRKANWRYGLSALKLLRPLAKIETISRVPFTLFLKPQYVTQLCQNRVKKPR